jgi:hypothetical protein
MPPINLPSALRLGIRLPNPHTLSTRHSSLRYLTSPTARRAGLLTLCIMLPIGAIATAASCPLYSGTVVFWISAMLMAKMMVPIFILLGLQRGDGASHLQIDEERDGGFPHHGR